MIRAFFLSIFLCLPFGALAQEFRALARILPDVSAVVDRGQGLELHLALSQSVPYRLALFGGPDRLVLDFREVAWDSLPAGFDQAERVSELATGAASGAAGWSRMVLTLTEPMEIESAEMRTDPATGEAVVHLRLQPGSMQGEAGAGDAPLRVPLPPVRPNAPDDGRFVVALDPGHGGVDPGAEAGGLQEADIMLVFAQELKDQLVRTGAAEVVLTRDSDRFVSLSERISIARRSGADLFLSLHADALAEGRASGATIYTLSEDAMARAPGLTTERFDRDDLIGGVDLRHADDQVAELLMELAQLDTQPRSDALAETLLEALDVAGVPLHSAPRTEAGFTVLTAADIPSVLLEVGYLSDPGDRARLSDAGWRAEVQVALVAAILSWHRADSFRRNLLGR